MEATSRPIELFDKAKEFGQESIAITDHATLAGHWPSLKASRSTGVKLIAGCDFNFVNSVDNKEESLRNIVLIAKNATGYKNLLLLSKLGFDNNVIAFKKAIPRIDWNLLSNYSEGLICLTSGGNGILAQLAMKRSDDLLPQAQKLKDIFQDNLAIEFQGHTLNRNANPYSGQIDQRFINIELKKIAEALNIRPIVTTNALYPTKNEYKAHDVMLAIGAGQPIGSRSRLYYNNNDFYLKTPIEIAQHFIRLNSIYSPTFIQSLFENTIYFDEQCEIPNWIETKYSNSGGKELPDFPVQQQPDYEEFAEWKKQHFPNIKNDMAYLRYACEIGLKKLVHSDHDIYKKRLEEEFDVIEYHGFSSYMLIVADFIQYAKNNNISVGPGRGSVGGSLIGYLTGIHIADPIKYKLVFARFHNKEKKSFPDIDTDFSSIGRERVQEYIVRKYGEDRVAHVSNIMNIKPKNYVKDIARTFEYGGGRSQAAKIAQEIADTIDGNPQTAPKTVLDALETTPLFAAYAEQYEELAEYADVVGGKPRAWSTHAAGLVIGSRPLAGLVPMRRDVHDAIALEYDKDAAEDNGLIKMDLLGLTNIDVIDKTYELIAERGKELPPMPLDHTQYDEKTYDLIAAGDVNSVFQLTGVASGLCKLIKPKSVEDIALITALIRPSAKAIVEDLVAVRNGNKTIQLPHELCERAFAGTYGFGLFEECLMWLAEDVAGWDLHSADRLRKMTKEKGKDSQKSKALREEFINSAVENKCLDKAIATQIWDEVVAPFGGYGFNISHATLYSILSFYTAYLKAHFRLEFLTACLMKEVDSNAKNADFKTLKIKADLRSHGIKIVAPDINTSGITYKIHDDKTLMSGLDALKYVSDEAIPNIVENRPYKSFEDFISKIDNGKIKAPAIQSLAASGSLDSFGMSRKQLFLHASDYKKKHQVWSKKDPKKRGQFNYPWPEVGDWTVAEKFAIEKHYLGEGVSGTIKERFPGFFDMFVNFKVLPKTYKYKFISDDERKNRQANTHKLPNDRIGSIRGVVDDVFTFKVKKEDSKIRGQTMSRFNLIDPVGNVLTIVAFPDALKKLEERLKDLSGGKQKLEAGIALDIVGDFQWENESTYSFILEDMFDYKPGPSLPEDLKAKKIKMPRKAKEVDIETMNKEELAEELEDEMIEDGISSVEDEVLDAL